MMYLDWFAETMKKRFNIEVNREDVGYEAYDFYHEEIDDLLIPAEHLVKLPNPLLIETLSYVDDEGYEWIVGYVLEEGTRKKLYEVWIENGEQIAYEFFVDCVALTSKIHDISFCNLTTKLKGIKSHFAKCINDKEMEWFLD